jgi:hypothetical protein
MIALISLAIFNIEARRKHIKLTIENLRGFGVLKPVQNAGALTYDIQQSLTPAKVLELLKEGIVFYRLCMIGLGLLYGLRGRCRAFAPGLKHR